MKKRTSIIWSIPLKDFEKVVRESSSFSEILKYFGLSHKGGNGKTLKKRLIEDKIDFSHIPLGQDSNKGRAFEKEKKPLEEVMVKNSSYSRNCLKKRLLKEKIIENKCAICGQLSVHNNKELVLILDHINGIPNDHRLENLRLLCPNCNSQQPTFAGKKLKKKHYCKKCGKEKINKHNELCYRESLRKPHCLRWG